MSLDAATCFHCTPDWLWQVKHRRTMHCDWPQGRLVWLPLTLNRKPQAVAAGSHSSNISYKSFALSPMFFFPFTNASIGIYIGWICEIKPKNFGNIMACHVRPLHFRLELVYFMMRRFNNPVNLKQRLISCAGK